MPLMKDLTRFRNVLYEWMNAAGVNQVSLAKTSGVDQASISRFLRTENPEGLRLSAALPLGRRKRPPADEG